MVAQRLGSQQRAAVYGEEADVPPTPAPTTGAQLRVLPERCRPRRHPHLHLSSQEGHVWDRGGIHTRRPKLLKTPRAPDPQVVRGGPWSSALLIPHSRLCGKGETQGGFFLTRRCARKAWGPLKTPLAPSEAVAFWFTTVSTCVSVAAGRGHLRCGPGFPSTVRGNHLRDVGRRAGRTPPAGGDGLGASAVGCVSDTRLVNLPVPSCHFPDQSQGFPRPAPAPVTSAAGGDAGRL